MAACGLFELLGFARSIGGIFETRAVAGQFRRRRMLISNPWGARSSRAAFADRLFFTDGNGGATRGCEHSNFLGKGCRPRDLASSKSSASCGRLAEPSLHRYLRLGIFELEDGILSSGASSKEVPGILRNSIELGRGELHLPPVADREHAYGLAGRERRRLSLLVQSAAAAHTYSSTQELFRRNRCPVARARSGCGCWTDGRRALPASAQFQSRRASP